MSLLDTLSIIQQKLTVYIYPLYFTFGVSGCLLNLIVFSRPQLRKTSCSIYFFAASIGHLFTLIVGIGPALYSLNNPNPQIQSLAFCKIRGYLFQISFVLSRWFVAFACIDRSALTSERVGLRNFASRKIAYRIIAIITIVWSIICSHRLIFYETKGSMCGIVMNMGATFYHSVYSIIGGGGLPAMIMIICACFIRRNLVRIRHMQKRFSVTRRVKKSIDQQVLGILFIQIICYIIFIIPQLGNLVFNTISITIPNRSADRLSIERFLVFIAEFMLYLFPVTSFYLYTLTSRTFRKELIGFFHSMRIRCLRNQVLPTIRIVAADYQLENRRPMATVIIR